PAGCGLGLPEATRGTCVPDAKHRPYGGYRQRCRAAPTWTHREVNTCCQKKALTPVRLSLPQQGRPPLWSPPPDRWDGPGLENLPGLPIIRPKSEKSIGDGIDASPVRRP